jgi:GNAT superfamily N-acetyltransferase
LWVSWFCVDQKYRGRGIGKTLLNHVIFYAKINNKKRFKIYASNIEEEKNN